MRFFDVTPSGQIMNRFSKDLDEGTWQLYFVMGTLMRLFGTFILSRMSMFLVVVSKLCV